jgi:hypothetical protein
MLEESLVLRLSLTCGAYLFFAPVQENIPLEEVFDNLRCNRQGLSTPMAEQRLQLFGPNKLEEKQVHESAPLLHAFLFPCLFTHQCGVRRLYDAWMRLCEQESKFLKFLGFMWNPLSWVMEAAAIMAIALANGGVSLLISTACEEEWRLWIQRSSCLLFFFCFPGEAAGLAGLRGDHHSAHHQLHHQFY